MLKTSSPQRKTSVKRIPRVTDIYFQQVHFGERVAEGTVRITHDSIKRFSFFSFCGNSRGSHHVCLEKRNLVSLSTSQKVTCPPTMAEQLFRISSHSGNVRSAESSSCFFCFRIYAGHVTLLTLRFNNELTLLGEIRSDLFHVQRKPQLSHRTFPSLL